MDDVGRKLAIKQSGVKRSCHEGKYHDRCQQPDQPQPGATIAGNNIQPTGIRPEFRSPEALGKLVEQTAHANAHSRSALRSTTLSTPTLNRTSSSPNPSCLRLSGGTLAWVITAG